MKKLQLLAVSLSCAAFTLFSCAEDAAEVSINWEDESNGTLEVVNTSNKDIVLFLGDRPTDSGIMGGVRAGATRRVDICKWVSDCGPGGWTIIRGITRDIYNDNIHDLTGVTKVDFSAMATYRADQMYRIRIDYDYIGDNIIRITNRGAVGMELRKNSPEGEKVAYLPALQQNLLLYTNSTSAMVLFPYYVLFNKETKTVTTLKASDMKESVTAAPRPATSTSVATIYFPNDASNSWEKIVGSLKSPVAYIKVENNVMGQAAYFTSGGSTWLYSQAGYDAINSGERNVIFEIEAADAIYEKAKDSEGIDIPNKFTDKIIGGGATPRLVAVYYGGTEMVPVLQYKNGVVEVDDAGEPISPRIYNGYDYTVSIDGPDSKGKFKASIEQHSKRDLSGLLEAM